MAAGIGLERGHNFDDLARRLPYGDLRFLIICHFNELGVAKIAHSTTPARSASRPAFSGIARIHGYRVSKVSLPPTETVSSCSSRGPSHLRLFAFKARWCRPRLAYADASNPNGAVDHDRCSRLDCR